jgi:hypothetical protein
MTTIYSSAREKAARAAWFYIQVSDGGAWNMLEAVEAALNAAAPDIERAAKIDALYEAAADLPWYLKWSAGHLRHRAGELERGER